MINGYISQRIVNYSEMRTIADVYNAYDFQ